MSLPAMTGSFANSLAPGFMEIIGTGLVERETYYSRFYNVKSSTRAYEDVFAGTGLPMATVKPEAEPVTAYNPLEGDTKRFTHKTYGLGVEISAELWEDDLYAGMGSPVRDGAEGLTDGMAERVEIEAHRPFNAEGFDGSTFTVLPDASGLFATSHVPIEGGEAGAQSNREDVDLDQASYRAKLILFRKYVNDRGMRIPGYVKPARMIVGEDMRYIAQEVVNNPLSMEAVANRRDVLNVQPGMPIEVTPYMTDADSWIIQGQRHAMNFLWRRRPQFDAFDDRRSQVAIFTVTSRFVVAPAHWLGMFGSLGAG